MPRPQSPRRIGRDLQHRIFKPGGSSLAELETVTLSLDGLEALRLADCEGMYQDDACQHMGVSRATFSRILSQARQLAAEALVYGKAIQIAGGEIQISEEEDLPCCLRGEQKRKRGALQGHCRHRHRLNLPEEPTGKPEE